MPKPAESSSHLSPPQNETAGPTQLNVSALPTDAGKGQSDSKESCVAPGVTQELISTSTATASLPVSVSVGADQQTEKAKVERKKKDQKSMFTGAQTTLDQNANVNQNSNIKSSTGNQMETDQDVEPQKNHSSGGDSSVRVEQSETQQSASSDHEKTESEKHNESINTETNKDIQHVSSSKTKKYAKAF